VTRILQVVPGDEHLRMADVAVFADQPPARVTVAMYPDLPHPGARTGRPWALFADAVLQVPTTMLWGRRDGVTAGIPLVQSAASRS
jgi:hypothetical protein